eukprot:CAMPEP_0170494972 /NCGR_PEP_ID=MMETSP0208-20121228/14943_1 /TAXON_ID=197538 /ORGANISM="Strombidium inclinatum, Strain S3" /LENGTH=128 /DNA_ID=CAMNT_0010771099 /DNA_START=1335 /DNA_END=1721 /DNA_ORIENTATION=-
MSEAMVQYLSLLQAEVPETQTFNLVGHLEASMEVLTAVKGAHVRMKYIDEPTIPRMVKGDLRKIKFCFKTLTELCCSSKCLDDEFSDLRVSQRDATITKSTIVVAASVKMEEEKFALFKTASSGSVSL